MKIILATQNPNKVREFSAILSQYKELGHVDLFTFSDFGLSNDIEENGKTFEENAMIKAKSNQLDGYIIIGEDSGLEVDALNGAPGIYSARYSGQHGDDRANNRKLIEEMKDIPEGKRAARYVAAIACVLPDGRTFSVRGTTEGSILFKESGNGGFGYDPFFYSNDLQKSFGIASPSEKNAVSHRARAIKFFAEKLISLSIN